MNIVVLQQLFIEKNKELALAIKNGQPHQELYTLLDNIQELAAEVKKRRRGNMYTTSVTRTGTLRRHLED